MRVRTKKTMMIMKSQVKNKSKKSLSNRKPSSRSRIGPPSNSKVTISSSRVKAEPVPSHAIPLPETSTL